MVREVNEGRTKTENEFWKKLREKFYKEGLRSRAKFCNTGKNSCTLKCAFKVRNLLSLRMIIKIHRVRGKKERKKESFFEVGVSICSKNMQLETATFILQKILNGNRILGTW